MPASYDGLTFDRIGHASVRIETGEGIVVYVDPWSTVLDGEPRDGDVIFVTHDDVDHYDPEAIHAVAKEGATVAVYEAVDTGDLGVAVEQLPLEGQTTVAGIGVETVPAYNDPDGDHVDEDGEPYHAEGEVIGLVLTVDGTTVFYPSDTDFLPHHQRISPDVLLPPIGGHFTMDRHEAASLAQNLEPELVLPVHYDTFEQVETDAADFAEELESEGIDVELF